MNEVRTRKSGLLVLATGAVLMALAFSGCPLLNPAEPVVIHTETVYFIGNLSGTLADEIATVFKNLVAYDGASADAPIFIAADSVQTLSEAEQQGVRDTFENYYPIIVVHGDAADNNALLTVLGFEPNYTLPEGEEYSELFAVDREDDGQLFVWAMYPPYEGAAVSDNPNAPPLPAYSDNPADQLVRTGIFHRWVDDNANRMGVEEMEVRKEAAEALTAAAKAGGGGHADLVNIMPGVVNTAHVSREGNNFTLTWTVYAFRAFTASPWEMDDWVYVRQDATLDASGGYSGIQRPFMQPAKCGLYIRDYMMNNWMDLPDYGDESNFKVTLPNSMPSNIDYARSSTDGVGATILGAVAVQGPGITSDVTINDARTRFVEHYTIENHSGVNDKGNNAGWAYVFPWQWNGNNDEPPLVQRGIFQPCNQWVWTFGPGVRGIAKGKSLKTAFAVYVGYGILNLYDIFGAEDYTYAERQFNCDVPITYLPIVSVTPSLTFGAAGGTQAASVAMGEPLWQASSDQDWCTIDRTDGSNVDTTIQVTVTPNTTGAARVAHVTVQSLIHTGYDTITVTQSAN